MSSDDSPSTDPLNDASDFVSKTELKRLAQQATELGKQLVSLDKATLNKLDLPANVLENVVTTQSIKSNIARKRQLQYLGKQIRNSDMQHIQQQLAKIQHQHRHDTAQFHKLEQWRDQLLEQNDTAINQFLDNYPHADRQHLRQLVRQAHQEAKKNAAPAAARKLFRYIKDVVEDR
jgi:ribosome-associated protein